MNLQPCEECKAEFDPLWRVDEEAKLNDMQLAGVLTQVKYCSEACKKRAQNRRAYARRLKRGKGATACGYAKALYRDHDFDPDIAILAAWYWMHGRPPRSRNHAYSTMLLKVRHVPVVSSELAEEMLHVYNENR